MTTEVVESIPAADLPEVIEHLDLTITVDGTTLTGTVAEIVQQAYQIGWQTGAAAERDAMRPEIERVGRLLREYLAGHASTPAGAQPVVRSLVISRDESGRMIGVDEVRATA